MLPSSYKYQSNNSERIQRSANKDEFRDTLHESQEDINLGRVFQPSSPNYPPKIAESPQHITTENKSFSNLCHYARLHEENGCLADTEYRKHVEEFKYYAKFTKKCTIAYYSVLGKKNEPEIIKNTPFVTATGDGGKGSQKSTLTHFRNGIVQNMRSKIDSSVNDDGYPTSKEYCSKCLFVALRGDCLAVIEESQKFLMMGVMVYLQDTDTKLFEKEHNCDTSYHLIGKPNHE